MATFSLTRPSGRFAANCEDGLGSSSLYLHAPCL